MNGYHRIAISDQRIISIDHQNVRFRYKDYASGAEHKVMVLDAVEFIRRYL
ncbi:MAG: IS91 family transposase, partial [bacterium]|nr:IS91 family transposase [bacterium]